jgi:signal transduction histidine kinase
MVEMNEALMVGSVHQHELTEAADKLNAQLRTEISERKRAEQELATAKDAVNHYAVELENTVAERTARLRETIGELEAFSYSVSHDMRAPLRAMRGFSKILLERHSAKLDAEGVNYLERIDAAAGRMDALIQDVLTYTRVLRADVKIEPVELDALVRQVIGIYPQLQSGEVEIQIEGVLPKVMGGEASLAQCISNLLTNAVKFVAPGTKPRIKIRAEAIAADIRLWVEDNGIGIAPEDQVRIFKMFERVDRATAYEGTGMGLTIVRKAVERMGGQMGVESEFGHGSKFWIQLKGAKHE